MNPQTGAVLGRLFREAPRVGQSDILQLQSELVELTPKDHNKLFKAESKTLTPQAQQSKLDASTGRVEKLGVSPCKTTIETLTLSNGRKTPVSWKISRPSQCTAQYFFSCSPSMGTLEKGKSIRIKICCVLFTPQHSFVDLLSIATTASGTASTAYLPILIHFAPSQVATREPYWSIDLSELTFISSPSPDPHNTSYSPQPNSSSSTHSHSNTNTGASPQNNAISNLQSTLSGSAASLPLFNDIALQVQGGSSPSSSTNSELGAVDAIEFAPNSHGPMPRSLTPPPHSSIFSPTGSSPSTSPSPMSAANAHSGSPGGGIHFPTALVGFVQHGTGPLVPQPAAIPVTTASADLYGTKVFVRRWKIEENSPPPRACLDEIAALKRLYHPHLASFIGARAEKGQAYIITKFMEGGPFEKFLKQSLLPSNSSANYSPLLTHAGSPNISSSGFLSASTSSLPSISNTTTQKRDTGALLKRLEMMLDVAYAMAFLHGKGIVHRHLSTSNMLLDENKRIRLCETSDNQTGTTAAVVTSSTSAISAVTSINVYLAPELMGNGQTVNPPPTLGTYLAIKSKNSDSGENPSSNLATEDPLQREHEVLMASDVFAFGICLWEVIVGVKPARSAMDLVSGYTPPLECDMAMFPDLVELLHACLLRDPLARPLFSGIISELSAIIESAPKRTPFHFAMPRNKTIKDDLISDFPNTLVFLDMASNVHLTDACAQSLPRSLIHLDLAMVSNFTDEAIAYLPPLLTHLDLSSATKLTDQAIALMPRGLQLLSLRDNTNLTENCLSGLPSSLLTLNLLNSSKLNPESSLPKFPTSLTDFTVPFGWIISFKDEHIPMLPASLRTLNFATNTTLTTEGISKLSAKMRHINLAANSLVNRETLIAMPAALETLNLASATLLVDDDIQYLPMSLQQLNLSRNKNIGNSGVKLLPQNLVSLNLGSTQNVLDGCIKSMPRSLTTLILCSNKHLTDEAIKDLPLSLTELNLAANSLLTDACVSAFPASLKTLNLFANRKFSDASIRWLPRSLTELNLSSNENFSDACLPDMPRSLRVLYLRKSTAFTDGGIQYLPRSLTHLDMSAARHLTDECACDMPSGLVTLELWKNQNLTKENLKARLPLIRVLALNVE